MIYEVEGRVFNSYDDMVNFYVEDFLSFVYNGSEEGSSDFMYKLYKIDTYISDVVNDHFSSYTSDFRFCLIEEISLYFYNQFIDEDYWEDFVNQYFDYFPQVGRTLQHPILYIRRKTGFSQEQLSNYFSIPLRTIQNWEESSRNIKKYILDLIIYKLQKEGLLNFPEI